MLSTASVFLHVPVRNSRAIVLRRTGIETGIASSAASPENFHCHIYKMQN
jgi:hypothetical protein